MTQADVKKAAKKRLAAAVNAQDLEAVENELKAKTPIAAADMIHAAGLGWRPGLALLVKHGGDLNASHRNYRPLHALIQEKPHVAFGFRSRRPADRARRAHR